MYLPSTYTEGWMRINDFYCGIVDVLDEYRYMNHIVLLSFFSPEDKVSSSKVLNIFGLSFSVSCLCVELIDSIIFRDVSYSHSKP